jgi:hypothetical protein
MTKGKKILSGLLLSFLALGFLSDSTEPSDRTPMLIIGSLLLISGVWFLISAFRKPSPCPICGSTNRILLEGSAKRRDSSQIMPYQKCASCGHLWTPPTPLWFKLLAVFCALFVALVIFSQVIDQSFLNGNQIKGSFLKGGAIAVALSIFIRFAYRKK